MRWEPVTTGHSGARVSRAGEVFRKEADDVDLREEAARMRWLRDQGFPAPRVLKCESHLLVTAALPGRTAAEPWPEDDRPRVVDALAAFMRRLHALPVDDCPFDRRVGPTLPVELRDSRPDSEDLVVCHGDPCLPNVLLDPVTLAVTGVVDVGRLGVADRWADLALTTRSLTSHLNPQYGSWAADRFLAAYGTDPDPARSDFYRRLDRLG